MKNLSIQIKIAILCVTLLSVLMGVGGLGYYSVSHAADSLDQLDGVEMPLSHAMTLADMYHDGISALIYRAELAAISGTADEKKEINSDYVEMAKSFREQVAVFEKLATEPELQKLVAGTKPDIEAYLAAADLGIKVGIRGNPDETKVSHATFLNAFKVLEAKFEKLGFAINGRFTKLADADVLFLHRMRLFSLLILLGGSVVGIVLSFVVIKNIKDVLGSTIGSLRASVSDLTAASVASASSSTQLSESAAEQASGLQETMASAEEISAMVNQNADSAAKVRSAVEANQLVSEEGSRSVAAMMVAIDEIKSTNDQVLSQMEDSNKEFAQIVKIISEIGEKTKVINDIVFQTKLLSFNASVEAARAGEHGKGFAVVAEEVGNLAQMSGNAAKEITDMLSGSIKRVNEIVETTSRRVDQLVEVGKDKISMGQSTAQKCRAALETIAQNAKNVSAMVAEIAAASKEQAQGVSEINKAISQLDVVTQQNSDLAQQSSTQAESLSIGSRTLTGLVDSLTLLVNGESKRSFEAANVVGPPSAKKVSTPKNIIPLNSTKSPKNHSLRAEQAVELSHKMNRSAANGDVPDHSESGFEEF